MPTHITYGPDGYLPDEPDNNIVETTEVDDPAPSEPSIEERIAALEAAVLDEAP